MVVERYLSLLESVATHAQAVGRDPATLTVIAVSKGRPLEEIKLLYAVGCRHFGENRLPESLEKKAEIAADVEWHMIGALQTKKVPKAIGQFALIHSVDTPALAEKISQVSEREGVKTKILLQVNTSGEKSKQGLSPAEWGLALPALKKLPALELSGLMTMAPLTENELVIRESFRTLRLCRDQWGVGPFLSMGMSHDWRIALEEGATHLRIGSTIFLG